MRNITIEWVRSAAGSFEDGYVGKWKVGCAFNDASTSREDKLKWGATCQLPGIKTDLGHYRTPDEARARVGQAVRYWFSCLSDEPGIKPATKEA